MRRTQITQSRSIDNQDYVLSAGQQDDPDQLGGKRPSTPQGQCVDPTQSYDFYVCHHAVERYLERVDCTEKYRRSRISLEFIEAIDVELDDPDITDRVRVHPVSGVGYVYDPDEMEVRTCIIPGPDVLPSGRRVEA